MRAYRLTKPNPPDALDAEGARSFGGRWNGRGIPALYFASTVALAILEVRVHAPHPHPAQRRLHTVELADHATATIEQLGLLLPEGWDNRPAGAASQAFGDRWLASMKSVALLVPSVVSPHDFNIVVNPRHPRFQSGVTVVEHVDVQLDRRLWAAR